MISTTENLEGFLKWIRRTEPDKNGWRLVPIADFDTRIIEAAIRALKKLENFNESR